MHVRGEVGGALFLMSLSVQQCFKGFPLSSVPFSIIIMGVARAAEGGAEGAVCLRGQGASSTNVK